MYKLLVTVLFVALCAWTTMAQDEYHKFEVYGGYSQDISKNPNIHINNAANEREGAATVDPKIFMGFNASATFNFSRYLGIKVDLADHFSTGELQAGAASFGQLAIAETKKSRLTIQSGLQIKNNSKEARFKPFGHVLAGINRQTIKLVNPDQFTLDMFGGDKITSTGFAATFGGGLDIKVSRRIDIRAIQFNYTINTVQSKPLGQVPIPIFGGTFATSLEGGTQNQFTFGFGVTIH